jgi:hypothetical protein
LDLQYGGTERRPPLLEWLRVRTEAEGCHD